MYPATNSQNHFGPSPVGLPHERWNGILPNLQHACRIISHRGPPQNREFFFHWFGTDPSTGKGYPNSWASASGVSTGALLIYWGNEEAAAREKCKDWVRDCGGTGVNGKLVRFEWPEEFLDQEEAAVGNAWDWRCEKCAEAILEWIKEDEEEYLWRRFCIAARK